MSKEFDYEGWCVEMMNIVFDQYNKWEQQDNEIMDKVYNSITKEKEI